MDIAFKPPVLLLLIAAGILVVAVLAALLKKMQPWKKILTVGLAVAACGAGLFFFYHTTHLIVDDQGIHANTYGRISVSWTDVQKAVLVSDLKGSPYAPTMRMNGVSIGDYHAGWFRISNGETAFFTTVIPDRALVIEGDGKTFVFGPDLLDAFTAEVAKHVKVEGRPS